VPRGIISIDTLRADRLGSYGYARQTSPAIDSLARRGIVLDKAIAESSWTLPSHVTIFTGLYPTTHGAVDYTRSLPDGIPTLAGVLRRNGFATAAFVEGGYLNKRQGGATGGAVELYDLEGDPAERSNVQTSHGAEVKSLMGALDAHFARLRRESAGHAREPNEEEIEKLRSLGYVE
jgi:hypothetical protein